jgi:hypothetical protein
MNTEAGYGGGWYKEGQFFATVGLSPEEQATVNTFDVGSGKIVITTVKAVYCDKKPVLLALCINVAKPGSDAKSIEYQANEVSTEVSYDAKWKQVSVKKQVLVEPVIFYYELICEQY